MAIIASHPRPSRQVTKTGARRRVFRLDRSGVGVFKLSESDLVAVHGQRPVVHVGGVDIDPFNLGTSLTESLSIIPTESNFGSWRTIFGEIETEDRLDDVSGRQLSKEPINTLSAHLIRTKSNDTREPIVIEISALIHSQELEVAHASALRLIIREAEHIRSSTSSYETLSILDFSSTLFLGKEIRTLLTYEFLKLSAVTFCRFASVGNEIKA